MDANYARTSVGVVVALLIGSVFIAPFTAAQVDHVESTAAPTIVFDVEKTKTITGTSAGTYAVATDGTLGPIQYNNTYDVTFTNVSSTSANPLNDDIYVLYAAGSSSIVATASPSIDGAHSTGSVTKYNVTFPASAVGSTSPVQGKFDQVGAWTFERQSAGAGGATGAIRNILVNATEVLSVALSQASFSYTTSQISFTITVTNSQTGAAVSNAQVKLGGLSALTLTTNANGVATFSGAAPEAADYTITATKDIAGDSKPEQTGKATLAVTASGLGATAVSTDVLRGFSGTVEFNFTAPGTSKAMLKDSTVQSYTVNVTYPNGTWVRYTGSGPTGAGVTLSPDGASTILNAATTTTATVDADGNVNFADTRASGWQQGTYSMKLDVNTRGAAKAEYTGSVSWTPAAPAPVNIQVTTGLTDGKLNVQNQAAGNGLPPASSLTTSITLENKNAHPGAGFVADHTSTTSNVTLEGDFLKIVDTNGNQLAPTISGYNAATGEFTIGNLYPTVGGGKVTVKVFWNGTTWTKDIAINKGGAIASDKSTIVVDTTETITFTLRLPSGSIDPSGTVRIYRAASGTSAVALTPVQAIAGTGNEGRGQDGEYTFTLKLDTLGTYVVFGEVGDDLGAQGDYRNWTYTTFRVVPAHDLQGELLKGSEILGSKNTELAVNLTKADGSTYTRGAQNPSFYVLNATQLATFKAKGQLPAAVSSVTVYPATGAIKSYNFSQDILEVGTYHVYARSFDGKHDNLDDMPSFNVTNARITFSPAAIVNNKDIESNTTITVTVTGPDGKALNGTLTWATSDGRALFYGASLVGGSNQSVMPKIKIVNGEATFKATGTKLGAVKFGFDPEDSSGAAAFNTVTGANGQFSVVTPNVLVNPERIPVGQTTPVTITVKDLAGKNLTGLNVQICGAPIGGGCTGNEITDADGKVRLGVTPFATGNLTMRVGGNPTTTNVTVFAGLVLSASPEFPTVGDQVVLKASQPGREAESGVLITVKSGDETVFDGTTGSLGILRWDATAAGTYTVTAAKVGFETASIQLTVDEAPEPEPVKAAKFEVSDLSVQPSKIELGSDVLATVSVKNTGDAEGTATARLKVNGVTLESKDVTLGAGESDTIGLTFAPTAAGTYEITVELRDGQKAGPVTLTVEKPAPVTPPAGGDGTDGKDGSDGKDDNIDGDVPGFSAVVALAAIGVALVLFRRRN